LSCRRYFSWFSGLFPAGRSFPLHGAVDHHFHGDRAIDPATFDTGILFPPIVCATCLEDKVLLHSRKTILQLRLLAQMRSADCIEQCPLSEVLSLANKAVGADGVTISTVVFTMDAETLRPSRSVLTTVRRLPLIRRQRPLWIADQRYNRIFLDAETLRQREHRRIEWPTIPGTSPPSAVGNARVEYPPTRTCRFLNITIVRL
jgi:hypothetical protein